MSQSKKFANNIAVHNHGEKVATEDEYMPGVSIGYHHLIPILRIMERTFLVPETSLINVFSLIPV